MPRGGEGNRLAVSARRASISFVQPENEFAQVYAAAPDHWHGAALVPEFAMHWKRRALAHAHPSDSEDDDASALLKQEDRRQPPPPPPHLVPLPLVIGSDCALTVLVNFYNSHLLKHVPGFHFPLTYSFVSFGTAAVGAWLLARRAGVPVTTSELFELRAPLGALALVRVCSTAATNLSLGFIELSIFKVLLLTGPCFVVALAALLPRCTGTADHAPPADAKADSQAEDEHGSGASCGGVGVAKVLVLCGLASGAAITCAFQPGLTPTQLVGICLALGSTAIGALGVVLSGVLLAEHKLPPLALLLYLSPLQASLIGSALPFTEMAPFVKWASELSVANSAGRLLLGACLAFMLQMTTFTTVQRTSAVSAAMLGNLKSLTTIALAVLLMGARVSPPCAAGYACSVLAGAAYTMLVIKEQREEAERKKRNGGGARGPTASASAAGAKAVAERPLDAK